MRRLFSSIVVVVAVTSATVAAQDPSPASSETPPASTEHDHAHMHDAAGPPSADAQAAEAQPDHAHMHDAAAAQTADTPVDHSAMHHGTSASASAWSVMTDGVVYGMFDHQGGPRGGKQFKAPNWWMAMATGSAGRSQFVLNAMFSFDEAAMGKRGYREIFQVGESINGEPLVDYQHPHDTFMALEAAWRIRIGTRTGFTLSGGPVASPALGPVPFMHRASAAENPMAPLTHHTFDSTHISFGVVTAAVDQGPVTVEGSLFNGREPDEHRSNFDFGRLDSVAGRVTVRPKAGWEFQVSSAHLREPERLDPENVQRTTASVSWFKPANANFTAVTVGYGVNAHHEATRHGGFAEVAWRAGMNGIFGRSELVQVETDLLLQENSLIRTDAAALKSTVGAFTAGGMRDIVRWRGLEAGLGASATVYAVPELLRPSYGRSPVSYQVFFRLRPPTGRMWNMQMSQVMSPHDMTHHAGSDSPPR